MAKYINITQIIVSILLIAAVLLQARGVGLGTVFGGEGNVFRTKRGLEKILFTSTIVLAVAFLGIALVNILISR